MKPSMHLKDRFGYVADLGEIDVPPRAWDEISARIERGSELDSSIRRRKVSVVVLTYRRGTHDGAVVLDVWPTAAGHITVRRLSSCADTEAARSARSGLHASELGTSHVAVVGAGALGSFVADLLTRSGIRRLTLIDDEIVMPGNIVRHLVGPEAVGMLKVQAVKQHLLHRHDLAAQDIDARPQSLGTGPDALKLLQEHDLVVDATADFATTALLHLAAESLGKHLLSAALQNSGRTYRIDILPPLDGTSAVPRSTMKVGSETPWLFEAGCGSPISSTAPHAVIEAAAATVRHAIGLLLRNPLHPAGEVRHLQTPFPERTLA
jgi:hypothetical protein